MRAQTKLTTHDMSIVLSEQYDRLETQLKRIEVINSQLSVIDGRMLKYTKDVDEITQRKLNIDTTSLSQSFEQEMVKIIQNNNELRNLIAKELHTINMIFKFLLCVITTISSAANQSNIIAPAVINPGARNWTVAQAPNKVGDVYQNLFYTFSNSSVAAGSRMALNLDCTYDRDGNFATKGDQMPVAYKIELNGSGAGDFNRNGYYRIEVLVDGLTGADVSATITVAGWNSPITQTVNVGQ